MTTTLLRATVRLPGLLGLAAISAFTAPPAGAQNASTTTIILMRHAEKLDGSRDPSLNPAGEARAATLAYMLGEVPIDAIYSTPFARTRETVRPLAAARRLAVIEVAPTRSFADDLATRIRAEHSGGVVVVVGHSNTTPDVMRALGIVEPSPIAEDEYDNLYVVTIAPDGSATLLALRYGTPTP
ncbi:MAG TPA: histidine phosphatase family protein [Gemmatimonadales bacterium]